MLDMIQILSDEIEAYRRSFFIKFILSLALLSILIYLLIFAFFSSLILSEKERYFNNECKKIISENIKEISYGSYKLKIHKYTDQETDFYDFCSFMWEFENIEQAKLELSLNKTYIAIAEIRLTYTYYHKGQRKTGTRFHGTIIKLNNKKELGKLPFIDYQVKEYRGATYIILYNPKKILEFDIFRKISKNNLENKIKDFILTLSYLT